jgi:hypothetical protein
MQWTDAKVIASQNQTLFPLVPNREGKLAA